MAHLLRLIAGYDKRSPIRTFTIANSSSTANIHLFSGGFAPAPGKQTTYWSGRSPRNHGQKRKGSSRDNARLSITYDLNGGSAAELRSLQSEITRFFEDVRRYEEEQISVPAWLEYRWHDNLDDIPAPLFGQFSYYIRILDGGPPEWPKTLHNTGVLTSGNIEQVMCELTCEPFWEGLPQLAGADLGQLEMTPWGLLAAAAVTNLCTNPSFGHATFNTGWSVSNAALHAVQESRFTHSLGVAMHLHNTHASAQQSTVTLTLTAASYTISAFVRRPDGAAVTSADMTLWGQGASRTTTFTRMQNTAWYRATAPFTGVAASSTHGVQVPTGREIIVDDVQIELSTHATPFAAGWMTGAAWAGTAHNSNSTRVASTMKWPANKELNGLFTVDGWITPYWNSADVGSLRDVFNYQISATTDFLNLVYDGADDRFEIVGERNNVAFSGNGSSHTVTAYNNIHLFLTQSETQLKLYVNGVLDITITTPGVYQSGAGVFYIGGVLNNFALNGAVDGWRMWDMTFTAAHVLQLYNNELEVKASYGLVGTPPVLWTKDGDSILDNVDDTNRDNWGMMAGVMGDVAASVEWRLTVPTALGTTMFMGRKATDDFFDPALLWLEFQGTASAIASDGEFEARTSSTNEIWSEAPLITNVKVLRGRYHYLSRIFCTTNTIVVQPVFQFGAASTGAASFGDESTIATGAGFLFQNFGDLHVYFDEDRITPNRCSVYLSTTPTTGSATVNVDFIMLLPYPAVRLEATDPAVSITAGDLLIVTDTQAYMYRPSDGTIRYEFEYQGSEPIDIEPGKYNYVWVLMGTEGVAYTVTLAATVAAYVTPRWLLPGGAVA